MDREDKSKYVLPSGLSTNGQQLKTKQHKLLQQYYQNQNQQSRYSQFDSLSRSRAQPQQQYLQQYDQQSKMANDKIRNSLTSDLLAQMEYKTLKKQYDKHHQLAQESNLIRHVSKFDSLEKEKIKQFNNKYKMEAQEDLHIKESNKMRDINDRLKEKQYYKNSYNMGRFPRSESVDNINKKQLYSNPTKQYYYEVEQAMRTRNYSNIDNPQTLRRNSSFKITQVNERVQKIDNMYNSSLRDHYNRQSNILESLKNKQINQKEDLKQALLTQIRQKERAKVQNKREYQIPYTTKDYKSLHHPINNPVDFRYAHDNRYVIGQLMSV